MAQVDRSLLKDTMQLYQEMRTKAAQLKTEADYRFFFTSSHAYITRQIYRHINLFEKPNDLMRLNKLFARDFLNAFKQPHGRWKDAFEVCAGFKKAREVGFIEQIAHDSFSHEGCAACMAKVHISQDLKNALKKERGVSPTDYGNVLILVNEGHLYTTKLLFGRRGATGRLFFALPTARNLGMTAERWRNEAWRAVMKTDVPKPTREFTSRYYKADGRPGY